MAREYRSDKANNSPIRNTTKEYLQQVFEINRLIKTRMEQLNTLKDIATRISPHTDSVRVDGSSNRGNMATTVERIVDLEHMINRDIERMKTVYIEVQDVIDTVTDSRQKNILTLRYLCFKKWDEIAEIMCMDKRWVYRLHKKALSSLTIESHYL